MRRLLSRRVGVAAMCEFGLSVGLAHIVVGMVWTVLNYNSVVRMATQLQSVLPAGADRVAFGVATLLWPFMLIAPALCGM